MKRRLAALSLLGAVVLAGCSLKPAENASGKDKPAEPKPEPAPVVYDDPTASDFQITFKVKSKECFGYGIGCNIEAEPELSIADSARFDPSVTYDVTYEVAGGDYDTIDTIRVTGDEYEFSPLYVSTGSKGAKLKAKIVDVEESAATIL